MFYRLDENNDGYQQEEAQTAKNVKRWCCLYKYVYHFNAGLIGTA